MLYCHSHLFSWALSVFLSQNEDAKEKKKIPSEKVHEVPEKASQSKGPNVAKKDGASAATDSCKDKKKQRNQKPVEKIKER